MSEQASSSLRREPPSFRRAAVVATFEVTPRLRRVSLAGEELAGFTVSEPASSVRVLLPPPDGEALVAPAWNGNEFLAADGTRPPLRTMTPLRVDPATGSFDIEVVVHAGGAASSWAGGVTPTGSGHEVLVSGPGRGYEVDEDAPAYLLAADETALPALGQVLADIPGDTPVTVVVEAGDPTGELDVVGYAGVSGAQVDVRWVFASSDGPTPAPGDALVGAVRDAFASAGGLVPGTKIWAGGEAAAMQRLRTWAFDDCGLTRSDATIRGYWKHGRAASSPD